MDFYVFDDAYNQLGLLSKPVSVTYTEKYKELGTFEVVLPINEENRILAKEENVIVFDRDRKIAGVVGIVTSTITSTGSPQLVVKGKFVAQYVYRRIVWGQFEMTGTPEQIITSLLNTQVLTPSDPSRKIPDLVMGASQLADQEQLSVQYSGDNLGTCIEAVCSTNPIGFRVSYEQIQKQMSFILYTGADRTDKQRVVPPVVFSAEYENILDSEYSVNAQDASNVAWVVGAKPVEGTQQSVTVGSVSGKARKEYYVNASSVRDQDSEGNPIPESQYREMLTQEGKEKLDSRKVAQSFECTINTLGNVQYNVDFFLGDKVTVRDQTVGIELDATISEVQHVINQYGSEQLYITFGFGPVTLTKRLRERGM